MSQGLVEIRNYEQIRTLLSFEKREMSHGTRSGDYGGGGKTINFCELKNDSQAQIYFYGVLSSRRAFLNLDTGHVYDNISWAF